MIFIDRKEAGKLLAAKLSEFEKNLETIVIALPRGGVIVGHEIAQALHIPLDIVCPRKIGAPLNPEFAIGAVTEKGDYILSTDIIERHFIPKEYISLEIERAKKEAQERLQRYRKDFPLRNLASKRILLVDDGLATGATMKAAIATLQNEQVNEIIMAIPVSPVTTLQKFSSLVNHIVCLIPAENFSAVGEFYENFDQITDEEVIKILHSHLKKK